MFFRKRPLEDGLWALKSCVGNEYLNQIDIAKQGSGTSRRQVVDDSQLRAQTSGAGRTPKATRIDVWCFYSIISMAVMFINQDF
jgi:hypothetical protein